MEEETKKKEEKKEQETWICPDCGETNTGRFCSNCGKKKPAEKPVAEVTKTEEKPAQKKGNMITQNWLLILIAFVLLTAIGLIANRNGGGTSSENQQTLIAPFGQQEQKVWTTLSSLDLCEIVAEFDMEIPDDPAEGYENVVYRAYTKQIIEVQYQNDEGTVGMAIRKGLGTSDDLSGDTTAYRKVEVLTIDGQDYTFKGDGTNISLVTWNDGTYAYCLACEVATQSQERAIELVQQIK